MVEAMTVARQAGADQLVSGTCSLLMSAPTGNSPCTARASPRCSRCGTGPPPRSPRTCSPADCVRSSPASTRPRPRPTSPGPGMTRNSSGSYRLGSTRVVSAVSSTPSSWTDPGSTPVWTSSSARSSSGTGSFSPTSSRPERSDGISYGRGSDTGGEVGARRHHVGVDDRGQGLDAVDEARPGSHERGVGIHRPHRHPRRQVTGLPELRGDLDRGG